jgi:hypothetical protein
MLEQVRRRAYNLMLGPERRKVIAEQESTMGFIAERRACI